MALSAFKFSYRMPAGGGSGAEQLAFFIGSTASINTFHIRAIGVDSDKNLYLFHTSATRKINKDLSGQTSYTWRHNATNQGYSNLINPVWDGTRFWSGAQGTGLNVYSHGFIWAMNPGSATMDYAYERYNGGATSYGSNFVSSKSSGQTVAMAGKYFVAGTHAYDGTLTQACWGAANTTGWVNGPRRVTNSTTAVTQMHLAYCDETYLFAIVEAHLLKINDAGTQSWSRACSSNHMAVCKVQGSTDFLVAAGSATGFGVARFQDINNTAVWRRSGNPSEFTTSAAQLYCHILPYKTSQYVAYARACTAGTQTQSRHLVFVGAVSDGATTFSAEVSYIDKTNEVIFTVPPRMTVDSDGNIYLGLQFRKSTDTSNYFRSVAVRIPYWVVDQGTSWASLDDPSGLFRIQANTAITIGTGGPTIPNLATASITYNSTGGTLTTGASYGNGSSSSASSSDFSLSTRNPA